MKTFSKKFKNWLCADDERISIKMVESKGKDLEDLLINAQVYFEDWNGNIVRDDWNSEDLHSKDYDKLQLILTEFLAGD